MRLFYIMENHWRIFFCADKCRRNPFLPIFYMGAYPIVLFFCSSQFVPEHMTCLSYHAQRRTSIYLVFPFINKGAGISLRWPAAPTPFLYFALRVYFFESNSSILPQVFLHFIHIEFPALLFFIVIQQMIGKFWYFLRIRFFPIKIHKHFHRQYKQK